MIFNDRSPFLINGGVGAWEERLRARHEAIIETNAARLRGASVLDIASHDGRWSFAALHAGARHVTGVEARLEHVERAHAIFSDAGIDLDRYHFHIGDVFERSDLFERQYDVVLCLGFLYHTTRQLELLAMIRKAGAPLLIVDTAVSASSEPVLELVRESVSRAGNGASRLETTGDDILVAHPSVPALSLMLGHLGYKITYFDWARRFGGGVTGWDGVLSEACPMADYEGGRRVTVVAELAASS